MCAYNNGWVKENLTEEVICTSEIVVSDVLSLRSNSILTMDLPFKYSDQKRKQILKSSNLNDNDLHDPIIHIKIKNLSTIKSYFAPQYSDYVEGVKMDSQKFVKQLFKLSLSRIKRVVAYIIVVIRDFNTIYYFKYPLFSSLCFIVSDYPYFGSHFYLAVYMVNFESRSVKPVCRLLVRIDAIMSI